MDAFPDDSRRVELANSMTHGLGAVLAIAALVVMVVSAALRGGARHVVGVSLFGACLVVLYTMSTLYHAFQGPRVKKVFHVFDHAAIFLLIAGSFTPFGLRIGGLLGVVSLAGLWLGAAAGIALVMRPQGVGKKARAAIYVGLGWAMVPLAPALLAQVGWHGITLLVAGGVFYTVGAVIYALRRPDPFPRTFGFHEIFHLLVIAAAACHFVAVARVAV